MKTNQEMKRGPELTIGGLLAVIREELEDVHVETGRTDEFDRVCKSLERAVSEKIAAETEIVKTKTIEYYCDLFEGWQDGDFIPRISEARQVGSKIAGYKRVKVSVDLPMVGGAADVDFEVNARVSKNEQ